MPVIFDNAERFSREFKEIHKNIKTDVNMLITSTQEQKMQIDKQVPLPEERNRYFHIFSPMQVGDSVFIDDANHQSPAVVQARASAARWKWKLTARREANGVRIWRVA